jgi:hypothetical protein
VVDAGEVAKNLIVPTGAYPCRWQHRGQLLSGELSLERSKAPVGELYDVPGTWVESEHSKSFQPHEDTADVLRGWTRRGDSAVLLDVRLGYLLPERSWVQAKVALIGHDLPEDMLFDSAEFQVGGLTELSGIRPLKTVAVPNTLENDPETSATWDSEATWQKWITAEGDEVELTFDPEIAWNQGFSFSLTAAPVIDVSGRPRAAEDWMSQYVRPLAEITSLATQRSQPVSWVLLRRGGKGKPPAQLFASDVVQQPYDATPPEHSELISYGSGSLIRLGPGGAALPDLLKGWASLRTRYGTFFDYLTLALPGSISTRSRFLALVPALEGLHVAKFGDGPMPRAEYKRRRKDVIRRLSDAQDVGQEDVDFIKDWLSVYGSYQLAQRLREIRDKELGAMLRSRIQERVDPLPAVLEGLVQGATDVWAVMGTARNRIAHGDANQPSAAQLATLTRIAHTVSIGAALSHLGIPDAVLCEAIDQDRWPLI